MPTFSVQASNLPAARAPPQSTPLGLPCCLPRPLGPTPWPQALKRPNRRRPFGWTPTTLGLAPNRSTPCPPFCWHPITLGLTPSRATLLASFLLTPYHFRPQTLEMPHPWPPCCWHPITLGLTPIRGHTPGLPAAASHQRSPWPTLAIYQKDLLKMTHSF